MKEILKAGDNKWQAVSSHSFVFYRKVSRLNSINTIVCHESPKKVTEASAYCDDVRNLGVLLSTEQ